MIVENIIKEPDKILRLTDLASKAKHRNAKNNVNFNQSMPRVEQSVYVQDD